MDPADQDAVRRTLEAQGRLLGQHDQLLTDIWSSLQTLNASVTALLASGRAELVPPPTPRRRRVASQPFLAAPREPHVPIPERYSAHMGILGNERADKVAKEAMKRSIFEEELKCQSEGNSMEKERKKKANEK
ncbi:hypothetical protein D4764_0240660 [Takifugu flavidus]|uniref:RNase H type-1 domain-containing protein n=1 Tax=Takifugu flavidus TaxID=433684 RepID=A0A5C6MJX1_9TELE|nr:hypothetical protein D4764_0240660 [Takifugu flavidus]